MSRQVPIYVYASDEEPTEGTFDSDATAVPESPSIHIRATSDDSSDVLLAPQTFSGTTPVTAHTIGESRHQVAETSRRPVMRRTPRMVIRDFPTGPLAPRDKAPMIEPEELPEEPPQKRLRFAHMDWMPYLLREWRSLEGIPSTFETGESSRSPPPLLTTGEPLELTIPTLVAVIRTLFRISANRGACSRELQSDVSRLDGDMASTYERLDFVESHRVVDREIIDTTRARVEVLERRARIAGFVVGVCMMIAVFGTTVGMYLPYFR